MRNRIFINAVLLLSVLLWISESCLTEMETDVLALLIKNLNTDHCILLKDSCKSINGAENAFRRFSKLGIFFAVMSVNSLVRYSKKNKSSQARVLITLKVNDLANFDTLLKMGLPKRINSRYKWVVLAESFSLNKIEQKEIYIPYNCYFFVAYPESGGQSYSVWDVYQLRENSYFIGELYGRYSNNVLRTVNQNVLSLRTNFYGFQMVIGRKQKVGEQKDPGCRYPMVCLHNSLIQDFQAALNFTSINKTEGDLQELNTSYDLFITGAPLLETKYSNNIVGPTINIKMNIFISSGASKQYNIWRAYLQPFSCRVWIAIIACIITNTCFLLVIFWYRRKRERDTLYDYLFLPFEMFCNAGGYICSRASSTRLLCLATRFPVFFLVPAYSAMIIAYLTIQKVSLPFTDINGLVRDGSYSLFAFKNTSTERYFKNRDNKRYFEIGQKFMPKSLVITDYPGAIKKLCKYDQLAFVGYNRHIYSYRTTCEILQLPTPILSSVFGIPLPRNSSLKIVLNRVLNRCRYSGVLSRYVKNLGSDRKRDDSKRLRPIEFLQVLTIFLVIGTGVIVGTVIMLLEIFYQNRTKYLRFYKRKQRIYKRKLLPLRYRARRMLRIGKDWINIRF